MIKKFKNDYGTDLDPKLDPYNIANIKESFTYFNKKFIKTQIEKIK